MTVVWVSFILMFVLVFLPVSSISPDLNPNVYPPDSSPLGKPYIDWTAEWWKWWLGLPAGKHPGEIQDSVWNASICGVMQKGPVWFLPDPGEAREKQINCIIPAGKSILLALSTGESDPTDPCVNDPEYSGLDMETRIRKCATENRISQEFYLLEVDGKQIKDFERLYRSTTGFFNIKIPDNPSPYFGGIEPGTYKAMTDGYFLFLKPLSVGQHIIKYEIEEQIRNDLQKHLGAATYNITVI